jgi:hypothetical protein
LEYQHQYSFYPGGTGGAGGEGGTEGGDGGKGEGSILKIENANSVHVQGAVEINIRQRDIILNWLSPINFFLRHADISQVRAKGTCGWLLEHPLFKKWESGSGSTLWCRGIRM